MLLVGEYDIVNTILVSWNMSPLWLLLDTEFSQRIPGIHKNKHNEAIQHYPLEEPMFSGFCLDNELYFLNLQNLFCICIHRGGGGGGGGGWRAVQDRDQFYRYDRKAFVVNGNSLIQGIF